MSPIVLQEMLQNVLKIQKKSCGKKMSHFSQFVKKWVDGVVCVVKDAVAAALSRL